MSSFAWAVTEHHNCQGEEAQELDGTAVIAIYAAEQAARQHVEREKPWRRYQVERVVIRSKLGPNWGLDFGGAA